MVLVVASRSDDNGVEQGYRGRRKGQAEPWQIIDRARPFFMEDIYTALQIVWSVSLMTGRIGLTREN